MVKSLPVLVLFIGMGIFIPSIYYFIFRKRARLDLIPAWIWAINGFVAFVLFPIFLFRKHWEAAMVMAKNKFWFVAGVVQMDNNFWETLAKLLAILVFIYFARPDRKEVFKQKSGSTIYGYWLGLCYGIGEAFTLSIIGFFPILNRIFGINLFMYFTTWQAVWERTYAIQVHAIIGALVGIGFYHWLGLGKRWWLLFFFFIGMLYHELVDGSVLAMMYFPKFAFVKFIGNNVLIITLPILVVIGYLILFIAYRSSKNVILSQEMKLENVKEII
jgi:hypothetical protein